MTLGALAGSRVRLGVFEESGSTTQAAGMWAVNSVKEVVGSAFEAITRIAVVAIRRTFDTLVHVWSGKHVASLARLARGSIKTVGAAFLAFNTDHCWIGLWEVSLRTGIDARDCSKTSWCSCWGKTVST